MTLSGSSATNQFGGSFDANGNLTSGGYIYDVENRMSHVNGGSSYAYDTQNRRIWQWNASLESPWNKSPAGYTVYFYGVDGKRLASYQLTANSFATGGNTTLVEMLSAVAVQDTYFGKRRLAPMDRLSSATAVGSQSVSFYPYLLLR